MSDSPNDAIRTWSNDPGMAARYAPIHDMVSELLARTDPDGYTNLLQDLRAQYKPEGLGEAHVIRLMADLSWRLRGCSYLETEISKRDMEACGAPKDAPGQALARVHKRKSNGRDQVATLSAYRSRLSREFSRCLRILELRAQRRKYAQASMAATLAKYKPCTSVIQ